MINKLSLVAAIMIAGSTLASANQEINKLGVNLGALDNVGKTLSDSLNNVQLSETDISDYAKLSNLSVEDARKKLFYSRNKEKVLKIINDNFKGRVAGVYVVNEPSYKLVVNMTGEESPANKLLNIENTLKTVLGVDYPVQINYGSKVTKDDALKQLDAAQALLIKVFPDMQSLSYDEQTGEIVAKVKGKESENTSAVKRAKDLWNITGIPLKVEFVNYVISPLASTYGGTPVVKITPGSTQRFDCTLGYGVKDSSGKQYMMSAAHCANDSQSKLDGTKYKTVKEHPFSEGTDLELNTTPNTVSNQFYVGTNQTRILTGRRSLSATSKNDEVCHYGASTGYSCGTVTETPAKIPGYPGTWVYVSAKNPKHCAGGDSGGPAFTGFSLASGIVSLGALDDTVPDTCYGYYYVPTDVIYSKGYSFVY